MNVRPLHDRIIVQRIEEGEQKGVFRRKVQQGSESWMNAVFEVLGEGAEKKFLEGAEKHGMKGLKGHRFVIPACFFSSGAA